MKVGYADFVRLCRVNDPENWVPGVVVRNDGIYLADLSVPLFASERAELTKCHPTGNLDDPLLKFPAELSVLRDMLDRVGASGCIDAFEMAEWLIEGGHVRSKWPWGNHETALLRHLSAAAEFWRSEAEGGKYVPEEPSTAPTNEVVVRFLTKDRKVPSRTAEVMATILRLDGLPPGPRK